MSSDLVSYFLTGCLTGWLTVMKPLNKYKDRKITLWQMGFHSVPCPLEVSMKVACGSRIRKIPTHLPCMPGSIKLGVLALVQCKGEFQELVYIFVIFQFEAHTSYPGHLCFLGAASKLVVRRARAS